MVASPSGTYPNPNSFIKHFNQPKKFPVQKTKKWKPTEPGYYFYSDGKDRYLVNVSQSCGAGGELDGPLMVTELKVNGGGYTVTTIGNMKGEWGRKLERTEEGIFKDREAQEMFDRFVTKYAGAWGTQYRSLIDPANSIVLVIVVSLREQPIDRPLIRP